VAETYACSASTYQRVASTVLYSGGSDPSGNRLGIIPWSTWPAKVRSRLRATSGRPVQRLMPGSEIMVSRPQSPNHG